MHTVIMSRDPKACAWESLHHPMVILTTLTVGCMAVLADDLIAIRLHIL